MRLFLISLFLFVCASSFAKVGISDRTGEILDTKTFHFFDESGKNISLASYFSPNKSVLLVPVFYNCSSVCNIVLVNLVQTLKQINFSPGRAFEVVVFSFDPSDIASLALAKKKSYLHLYERPETADGWHFLTGDAANIQALTQAIGFDYELDKASGQFSHAAAIYVLSPEGKISAIFPGSEYPRKELQIALQEATLGKLQIFLHRASAFCYAYMLHPGILNSPLRWFLLVFGIFFVLLTWRFRKILK